MQNEEQKVQPTSESGNAAKLPVMCRFAFGDKVLVRFRRLDRHWLGTVFKDDGGDEVEVTGSYDWMPTKVERWRISKMAS